ncbi:MAG TPA: recombinase family protein [Candidatus Acidoferrum sp.]|nr:recombinase family protein [Candidatus Acidoferrum sp.]
MAKLERVRESLEGSLDPEYLKQREKAGWRLVGVEWEREAEVLSAAGEGEPRLEDPPYGVRVGGDCDHLEENPQEMQFLLSMMELIIQDISLTKVAEELTRKGYRTRKGTEWGPVAVFNMLPRLIELTPRIFASEEWIERRKHLTLTY